MQSIQIKKLDISAKTPTRAHYTDAGLDLYANEDALLINQAVVGTGISINIPKGYVGLVWPRSGLSVKENIDVLAGVIDSGYTGEVKVVLSRNKPLPSYEIKKGDKIAQILIQKIETPFVELVEEFTNVASDREESGFGSTGL